MSESFVDLSYRGLSLGRRVKLGEVRPNSGYLELATPMPVGTQVAIATEDGVTIDAIVTWVYEQVGGSDRTPGMIVAPSLAEGAAAAWWKARVALPDDDAPRARPPRSRPVTVRPRPQTLPRPPSEATVIDEPPTIIADLDARVAAAAGLPPPRPPDDPSEQRTVVMNAVDQARLEQLARSTDAEATMRSTGDHVVIDDGHQTILMDALDPSELGIDAGDGDDGGTGGDDPEAGAPGEAGGDTAPPAAGGRKRRRRRSR